MDWFKSKEIVETTNQVVRIDERQQKQDFAPLAQIEAYWNGLRGTRPMPLRSEIDPRGLKGALENCFVLERIAPGLARLRVAGSHLGALMGMEVRGMPISSFLTADARQAFGEMLEEVFETPATAVVTLEAETGYGRPALVGKIILMPVRSDLGDTSRILGGFVTSGDIGRAPRRFNVTKIEIKPIVAKEMPARSTPQKLTQDIFRSAERAMPPQAPQPNAPQNSLADGIGKPIPGAPYLRVVK